MIGKISGLMEYKGDDHALIDVRGVGYLVFCSERTLASLPGPGEAVTLYTDLLVREDLLQLFGFPSLLEKEWHRLLMSVQGVGAKASLAILSALGVEGVNRSIALGDWNAIKAARGIGPKTAQRVVNELKDKAPAVMALGGVVPGAQRSAQAMEDVIEDAAAVAPQKAAGTERGNPAAQSEALSALSNLGYSPGEAAGAVAQAAGDSPGADTAALIRAALKLLAPKG